jgi:hypothetical protein
MHTYTHTHTHTQTVTEFKKEQGCVEVVNLERELDAGHADDRATVTHTHIHTRTRERENERERSRGGDREEGSERKEWAGRVSERRQT